MDVEILRLVLFEKPKTKVIGRVVVKYGGIVISGMSVIKGRYGPLVATNKCWSQGIQLFLSKELNRSIQFALRDALEKKPFSGFDGEEFNSCWGRMFSNVIV